MDFLIVAFAIFLMVKGINSLRRKQADKPAPAAPPAPTAEEKLLTEIRDLLKKETARRAGTANGFYIIQGNTDIPRAVTARGICVRYGPPSSCLRKYRPDADSGYDAGDPANPAGIALLNPVRVSIFAPAMKRPYNIRATIRTAAAVLLLCAPAKAMAQEAKPFARNFRGTENPLRNRYADGRPAVQHQQRTLA